MRRALPCPAEDLAPMGQRQAIRWGVVAAAEMYAWEAGLVFAFGGFWSLWLKRQHLLSAQEVTLSSLVLFLAVGVGTAMAGVLSQGSQQRCRFMVIGTTRGGITFLMLLLLPAAQQGRLHRLCMLLLGLSTAVGGLAWFGSLSVLGWLSALVLWRRSCAKHAPST